MSVRHAVTPGRRYQAGFFARIIDKMDKAPSATINTDVDDVIQVQAEAQRRLLLDVKV